MRIRKSSTPAAVRLVGKRAVPGRLLALPRQAVHPLLHLRPGHLAALHGEQGVTVLTDVDRQGARAQQVTGAGQEPQQVHRVLPARGAVGAYVGVELAALAVGVTGERLVGPAGEERLAEGEEFAAGVVHGVHQRGVQALQDVRVRAQGQFAEALQLPAELFLPGTLHMRRRLLEAPVQRGRREEDSPAVRVAVLRRQTEGARAHDAGVDGVVADQGLGGLGVHGGSVRGRLTPGGPNFPPP